MKEHKQGICPICGSENIAYGSSELGIDGNELYYPAECQDCGATFQEYYALEFIGHENVEPYEE